MDTPETGLGQDEKILLKLNDDYIHSDQRSDVALLHGRVRYTTKHDGRQREALYTDTYQRRDRQWMCVAGEVVAQGE